MVTLRQSSDSTAEVSLLHVFFFLFFSLLILRRLERPLFVCSWTGNNEPHTALGSGKQRTAPAVLHVLPT
jgi:hypothetical protein